MHASHEYTEAYCAYQIWRSEIRNCVTCRISPETSPKARILILVSGSAAFVVLGTRYICAFAFGAINTDIHLDESDGCNGFCACGGAGGWAGACAPSDCPARSTSGAPRLHQMHPAGGRARDGLPSCLGYMRRSSGFPQLGMGRRLGRFSGVCGCPCLGSATRPGGPDAPRLGNRCGGRRPSAV